MGGSRRGCAAQHGELPQHWHARLEPRRVLGVVLLEPQPRRGRRLSEVRRGVRIRAGGLQRPRAAGVVGQPLERDHGDPAVGETRRHELKNGLQLAW